MREHPRRRPCSCAACQALLHAVPAVVAEVGIARVTIADVAGAVGMTAATAQRHAPLDRLITASYRASAAHLHERLFSGFTGRATWADGVRHGITEVFEALNADPDRAVFCFGEVPQAGGTLRDARDGVRLASSVLWRQHHAVSVAEGVRLDRSRLEQLHGALLNRVNVGLRGGTLSGLDGDAVEELVLLAT